MITNEDNNKVLAYKNMKVLAEELNKYYLEVIFQIFF